MGLYQLFNVFKLSTIFLSIIILIFSCQKDENPNFKSNNETKKKLDEYESSINKKNKGKRNMKNDNDTISEQKAINIAKQFFTSKSKEIDLPYESDKIRNFKANKMKGKNIKEVYIVQLIKEKLYWKVDLETYHGGHWGPAWVIIDPIKGNIVHWTNHK